MSESSLKKTKNWFRCVGTCYEKDLKLSDGTVKLYKDGKPTGEEENCEVISGKVAVRTENGIVTFGVYFSSVSLDGSESKQWGMAKAMYEKWEPEINGMGEPATLVAIEGSVSVNDYVSQQGEVKSGLRWNVRRANTRVEADEAHGCTLNVVAFVNKVAHEMRNEEESGRLLVELLGADSKGGLIPINCIVEADLAEDFEELFETKVTAEFDIDYVTRHVGGVKGTKKAFGKGGKVNVNNGFDVTELIIVGADEPIEQPDELTYEDEDGNEHEVETLWINPKAIKNAIKVREAKLEELKNNPTETNNVKKSDTALKKAKSAQRVGKAKTSVAEPYTDDDDDDLF